MSNWFHRLFNPHCPECQAEKVCQSCDILREQLLKVTREKDELLNRLLPSSEIKVEEVTNYEPIRPKHIPWAIRKQMLEQEDRKEKVRLEELEKEVLNGG